MSEYGKLTISKEILDDKLFEVVDLELNYIFNKYKGFEITPSLYKHKFLLTFKSGEELVISFEDYLEYYFNQREGPHKCDNLHDYNDILMVEKL